MKTKESLPLKILTEVIKGHSLVSSRILGECKVRHVSLEDEARFKELYDEGFSLAVKKKIPDADKAKEILESKGLWTKADETEIVRLRSQVEAAQKSMEAVIPQQRKYLEGDLAAFVKKLQALIERRDSCAMTTAEDYATKMAFEGHIPFLFLNPSFDSEAVEYMDDSTMNEVVRVFSIVQNRTSPAMLKKAAVTAAAQNIIALSEDPFVIFGKPLVDLTTPQSQFIICTRNYKHLIGELQGKVDDEVLEDPEAMDEWAAAGEHARARLEQKWGAKTEDFSSYDAVKAAAESSDNRVSGLKAVQSLL